MKKEIWISYLLRVEAQSQSTEHKTISSENTKVTYEMAGGTRDIKK